MANTIRIKRSAVQGKIPLAADLQLGELAVNTYDGRLFTKKDAGGTISVVEIGGSFAINPIVNADVSASAEIAVSKFANGVAGQIIQTDSVGTGVEWSSTANLPLGSAAAPAYRFQGDPNTGIYSPGADQVAISTNGTGRLFVDASWNVGVGTSSPAPAIGNGATLHLYGASTTSELRLQRGNGTDLSLLAGSATGGASISLNNKFSISTDSNSTQAFTVDTSGRVGIGTSSPGGPLSVAFTNATVYSATTAANNALAAINSSATTGSFASVSLSSRNTANAGCTVNLLGISTSTNNASDFAIQQRTTSGVYRENLRITHDGSVGIGTTTPASRFETQEDTTSNTDLTITNANTGNNITKGARVRFRLTDSVGTRKDVAFISAYAYNLDSSAGNYLTFSTRTTDSTPTEKVRITNVGNVGIGITNPSDTLHVSGVINATSDMSLGGELNFYGVNNKFIDFYTNTGQAAHLRLVDSGSTSFHSAVRMLRDGAVELYHNNVEKLETTSQGITVFGSTLGATVGNTVTLVDFTHNNGNVSYLRVISRRNTTTQNWTGASTKIVNVTDVTDQGYIEFNPNGSAGGSIAIGQGGSESIRVLSSGNVGIGTTNPSRTLHIYSSSPIRFSDSNRVWDINLKAGKLVIGDDSASADRFTIDTSGNVGIGTTNPGYKLEVVGSFAATTKSFVIPHPTKEGYRLRYGSLEGPENGVYIRGRSKNFVIKLPEYWTKLVDPDSITINLTPIGKTQTLWVESIKENKVYVRSKCVEVEYFYTVFAERADVDKLEVELEEVN